MPTTPIGCRPTGTPPSWHRCCAPGSSATGRRSGSSPFAVAFRLQRSGLLWWTVALTTFGLIFGGMAAQIADPEGMSADRIEMFGGSVDTLVDGYLAIITLLAASLASIPTLLTVQSV